MRIVLVLFCSVIHGASSSSSLVKQVALYTLEKDGLVKEDIILSNSLSLKDQGITRSNIRVVRGTDRPYLISFGNVVPLSVELQILVRNKHLYRPIIHAFLKSNFYENTALHSFVALFKDSQGQVFRDIQQVDVQGNYVSTHHSDDTWRVWRAADSSLIGVIKNEQGRACKYIVRVDIQGDYVVARYAYDPWQVWRVADLSLIGVFKNSRGEAFDDIKQVNVQGNYMMTHHTNYDGWRMWRAVDLSLVRLKDSYGQAFDDIKQVDVLGNYVVTKHTRDEFRVWRAADLSPIQFKNSDGRVFRDIMQLTIQGNYVVTGHTGDVWRAWRAVDCSPVEFKDSQGRVFNDVTQVDMYGDYVATKHRDAVRRVWRGLDWSLMGVLSDEHGEVFRDIMQLTIQGNYVVTEHRIGQLSAWMMTDLSSVPLKSLQIGTNRQEMKIGNNYILKKHSDGLWEVWHLKAKYNFLVNKWSDQTIVFLYAAIKGLLAEGRHYIADGTYTVTKPILIGGTASITAAQLNLIYKALPADIIKVLRGYPYNLPQEFAQWFFTASAKQA